MPELDYYTVMQKRIEYFAKKYDPHDRYSPKPEEPKELFQTVTVPDVVKNKKKRKLAEVFTYLFSLLF